MIQYSYASDTKGRIVKITSLNRNKDLGTYYCVNCGTELIPRLGKIRRKHFAHKEERECSYETYLHKLAKKIFYNSYLACLKNNKPYFLEYLVQQNCNHFRNEFNITCHLGQQKQNFDLASYFTEIELEKRDGNLIPDVRIYNPNNSESIYIEIAVTHESEENKIKSGNRILEFLIKEENDIQLVAQKRVPLHEEKIIRYNFSQDGIETIDCEGNCIESKNVFQVFGSGKSILTNTKLKKLKRHLDNNVVNFFKIIHQEETKEKEPAYTYVQNVVQAHEKKSVIKNCFLCRYHAKNKNFRTKSIKPIFCKFLKEAYSSNKAVGCEYYRPDEDVYCEYR